MNCCRETVQMGVPARHREASAEADGPRAAQTLAPRAWKPSRDTGV